MNDYIVGSVANLISCGRPYKAQAQKKKLDSSNTYVNQITNINHKNKNDQYSMMASNASSKNESSLNFLEKCSIRNFSSRKADSKAPLKVKSNLELPNKTEAPLKKKEESLRDAVSNTTDCKQEKYEIRNADLLNLDHVPSDSEEEGEDLERNYIKKKNVNSKNASREYQENTIFIGNIPINYDKKKVCKLFSKFGEIQNARIRCVPVQNINMSKKVAAIKKKFNPKRNSVVAFVKYKLRDSAIAALKANGMVINGHHVRVDLAEETKVREKNKAVFVGGLPYDIEDDELWEFFQNCGEINSVRIIRDSQTSAGKGFGYVNFNSSASVELALQLDGQELKKRSINVQRCVRAGKKKELNSFDGKKSKSFKDQLLHKKGKKQKEKTKPKEGKNEFSGDFQGKTANMKQKKKKKLSKVALRQRKLMKILGAS